MQQGTRKGTPLHIRSDEDDGVVGAGRASSVESRTHAGLEQGARKGTPLHLRPGQCMSVGVLGILFHPTRRSKSATAF
ncbi:MAG: hypothetical protein H0U76_30020 [Ktedonobacteraceae bacterium]|nr:hypothetical protein [Ktedonobacteraceae bacterium]